MSINANQKGKRFEREISKYLSEKFNTDIKRTPNSGGLDMKGDILTTDLNNVLSEYNWECKNQEKLNIWKALSQSKGDCISSRKKPLVVFTKNFEDNYVAMKLEDFTQLLLEIDQLRNII